MSFSDDVLTRMQVTQTGLMQDVCMLLVFESDDELQDEYGMPLEEERVGDTVACGIDLTRQSEVMRGTEVLVADGKARLPYGTVVDGFDGLRVTHRYGVELDEYLDYEIVGPVEQGPSGVRVNIRRVS